MEVLSTIYVACYIINTIVGVVWVFQFVSSRFDKQQ